MSNEVAIVTQSVYSAADRVVFKAEGMAMWMDAVWPEYEKAKNDPRLALAVQRHVQHLAEKAREASKRAAETKALRRKKVKTSLCLRSIRPFPACSCAANRQRVPHGTSACGCRGRLELPQRRPRDRSYRSFTERLCYIPEAVERRLQAFDNFGSHFVGRWQQIGIV
jgi:hypothetical protein